MDFYTFGLSLDPHAVHQRHMLDDESDEEEDAETPSVDPQFQITPEVKNSASCHHVYIFNCSGIFLK